MPPTAVVYGDGVHTATVRVCVGGIYYSTMTSHVVPICPPAPIHIIRIQDVYVSMLGSL